MKYFLAIFGCALVCMGAFADEASSPFVSDLAGANQDMNTDEYQAVAKLQMELINSELDEIAETVRQLNPDLYYQMQPKSKMEQFYAYRSWLAVQAFDWYRNRLIADLKLKSKNTGRHIKIIESQNIDRVFLSDDELDKYISENCVGDAFMCQFWLDRGKYDTTECFTKDGFREEEICEYALDFEEYTLLIQPDEIFVVKGDAADNTFTFYNILKIEQETNISLDIQYSAGNLTEWIEYDNRTRRLNNTLNGMSDRERKEFIKQYNQAYINGEIDNYMPGLEVWGIGTDTIGLFQ